jgi:hypothetical protein
VHRASGAPGCSLNGAARLVLEACSGHVRVRAGTMVAHPSVGAAAEMTHLSSVLSAREYIIRGLDFSL